MTSTTDQQACIENLDERYATLRLIQPAQLTWMRESVARHGLLHPVIVNGAQDGTLVVLDGFKRLAVLREQEQREVWVRVVHLPDTAARAAILSYNAANRGGLSELEEGWIIRSLVRECKLRQNQVAELLGHHKSWVGRRLLLIEGLCESVQQDMRLGLVSPTVARELTRLPRGNQARVAQVVRDHGLTSRQAAELCTLHRAAQCGEMSSGALREVLADPLRFVARADPEARPRSKDPRLSEAGDEIRRQLVRFDQAAAGVRFVLNKYPVPMLREPDSRLLGPMGADIAERGQKTLERLAELAQANQDIPGQKLDDETERASERL